MIIISKERSKDILGSPKARGSLRLKAKPITTNLKGQKQADLEGGTKLQFWVWNLVEGLAKSPHSKVFSAYYPFESLRLFNFPLGTLQLESGIRDFYQNSTGTLQEIGGFEILPSFLLE